MQRYYWAAKAVSQLTSILLQNLQARLSNPGAAEPQALDDEFCMRGDLLEARDPALFQNQPAAIMRAFLHLCRRPELHGMTATTLRQLWHARTCIDAGFRRDPAHRALFLEILRQPHGVTRALRRMNQWSVLGRYLPVFRRIVGRMQHDLFHVYTVDQHILMVVRNLRRFGMAEFAHEYPFCSQLMASVPKPWLLVIAALFHDIAKGRGGDHSQLGRRDARRFCRDHGLSSDEQSLIEFLVEHHLTMSTVAQKQDLSDPEVIAQFARLVRDEDRLIALYLLTVADIRGTSPKVWNAWKAKLLEELFRATKRHLAGDRPADAERLDLHRAEAVRLLNLRTVPPERYRDFWAGMGISYFLRTDPVDIAWHARVLASPGNQGEQPLVRCRTSAIGEGFQVAVYMRDQPDLFARICAYFDRKNLSVLDAQIHTSPDGRVLDSFLVVDPGGQSSYRDILQIVENELAQVLAAGGALPAPVRGRISRRSRHFPVQPAVDLRPDERGRRYLLAVTANDRTGLLYTIANVLSRHGLTLHTARIMTLGERVEDVFVIDGAALSSPRGQLAFETELLSALQSA
jgi:[protein-PII] uridylyltransferase